jgi:hypothetical protein
MQSTQKSGIISVLNHDKSRDVRKPYETPRLQELGSISGMTLTASIDFNIS